MTWYNAVYGKWTDPDGVHRIDGTFSFKEIKEKAQQIADEKSVTVTILATNGMHLKTYKIEPRNNH